MVHIWDVKHRQVILLPMAEQNFTIPHVPVWTIAFADYFACNDNEWGENEAVPAKVESPELEPIIVKPVLRAPPPVHQQHPQPQHQQQQQLTRDHVARPDPSGKKSSEVGMIDYFGLGLMFGLTLLLLYVMDYFLTRDGIHVRRMR